MSIKLSVKGDLSPLLKLIIPLAMTGLVQSATWFFETIFLARLGQQTLAAGSLVSWLFGTIVVILFGTLGAINILVAHKHGENDQEGIALIARDGLVLGVLLVIPTFILFWYISPIFLLFGQDEATVSLAQSYLHALAWQLPAFFLTMACLEVIIGIGHARLILLFSIFSVSLNIIWSYILVFGKFGFPTFGIAGAGWGMTISAWVTAFILFAFIFAIKNYRNYFRYIFNFKKPTYLFELLQIGLPMGGMYCIEVAFFFALTLCMGLISSQMQAANQVALQYLGLFMSIIFSMAQAVTVRIGHLLGAKELVAIPKVNYIGIIIASIITTFVAIFYWKLPDILISIDFDVLNPKNFEIVGEIKKLLIVCGLFQIVEAIRITLFGSLRGLKETKFTLLVSFISFWCIALPVGYLLAMKLQLGSTGFWWGMILGAMMSIVLLQWKFNKKMRYYYKII